jgi:uncharacterized RDD family membrane protein YckC
MNAATQPPPAYTPPQARMRELVTPEGIDLRIVLAEAGERAAALLLDLAIILGVLIAATIALAIMGAVLNFGVEELIGVVWLLIAFFLRNFYFTAFELTPRAATPGKRALGLRVAMRDGGRLTAEAIFLRNVMREVELFVPITLVFAVGFSEDGLAYLMALVWCGVFVLFPLFNKDRLRVGDLVGGTWVVRAPKRVLDIDLAGDEVETEGLFSAEALDAYGVKELTVLEDVLRRRDPATMKAVAERIQYKTGARAFGSPLEFLQAYYKALRLHLESRLLFGRRRRDKYDKP